MSAAGDNCLLIYNEKVSK